jgi:murein DD-endopeptidase MepM/ murein hydrolase activator NlpD
MNLETILQQNIDSFASIFQPALNTQNIIPMDLTSANHEWSGLNEAQLDAAIQKKIDDAGAIAAVGGYLEDRNMYKDTELFQNDEQRSIHIGVDVFMPAGIALYAPLDGEVHSFANRRLSGDYGPVIILRHQLGDTVLHSLYGHLAESSLGNLSAGKKVARGEKIAAIGPRPVNGNWPPHLHFQIIHDMQGYQGDYPGVVRPAELEFFKQNCPDPWSLLVH